MRLFIALAVAGLLSSCRSARVIWSVAEAQPDTRRALVDGEVVGGEGRYGSQAWLGLPYAAPPVGANRWRAPQPVAPWEGQRQALKFGSACPQLASALGSSAGVAPGDPFGDEDCLYLNVWAPKVSLDSLASGGVHLPVVVWIHGGGNSIGSANFYDGGNLAASENLIVVSVQYRLGPLGWMRHKALRQGASEEEQSGNFTTLDLVAALKWVQANVAAFGGDPGNVTLMGESAGGFNVYSLLLTPLAKGLFHRAIAQSGGLSRIGTVEAEAFEGHVSSSNRALARVLVNKGRAKDEAEGRKLLEAMSEAEVASFMRGLPASELLVAYRPYMTAGMLNLPVGFPDGKVLPADWEKAFATPEGWNRVPVLIGTNRDEVKLFFALDPRRITRTLGLIPRYLNEPKYHADAEAMSRLWKVTGADQPASAMVESGATDVYLYRFDWRGEPVQYGVELSKLVGAAHAVEIPFVFNHWDVGRLGAYAYNEENRASREKLSKQMQGYWAEFARTGKPGKGSRGDLLEWKPWVRSSDAERQLLLDEDAGGGVRMAKSDESTEAIIASVLGDKRLTPEERCELLRSMTSFGHGITREQVLAGGGGACFENSHGAPARAQAE
jgi:para-nitrobenzyl esterase